MRKIMFPRNRLSFLRKHADACSMRILIQNVENRKYLAGDGEWVSAVRAANNFPMITLAYDVAKHIMPGKFRILLHLLDTDELINLIEGVGRPNRCALA